MFAQCWSRLHPSRGNTKAGWQNDWQSRRACNVCNFDVINLFESLLLCHACYIDKNNKLHVG